MDDAGATAPVEPSRVSPLEAACLRLAAARCRDFNICASYVDRAHYDGERACVRAVTAECLEDGALPGQLDPVARARACAEALERMSCDDLRDPSAQRRACRAPGVDPGTLEDGRPCVDARQCAGGRCAFVAQTGCGVCAHAPAIGASCASSSDCAHDVTDLRCVAGVCAPRAERDAPCTSSDDCRAGLSCIASICSVGAALEGQACDDGAAACDPREALACLGEEWKRCVRVPIVPLGGACVEVAMGLPLLCAGADAYCRPGSWTCERRNPPGGPCGDRLDCADRAVCVQAAGDFRCMPAADACR